MLHSSITDFLALRSVLLISNRIRAIQRKNNMPDISRDTERQESRIQEKSAQDKQDDNKVPAENPIEEEAQEVVQGAKQEVAATRLPWYRRIKRGYILLGIYALLFVLSALLATFVHFHPVL